MTNLTLLCAKRPRLLKQALDSIGDLSSAKVMIRDAGINSEVLKIADEWVLNGKSYPQLGRSVMRGDPKGTGPSRNEVISLAEHFQGRGDYLYLSDDDVFWLREDWLKILIDAYENAWEQGYRVLAAYNHPYNGPIAGEPWLNDSHPNNWAVYPVYAVSTQSMLMRWSVWDDFGPFCDTPAGKVCQSEDGDFSNRVRAAGFKVGVITPPLLVNCGVTNSFNQPIPGADMVKAQAPPGVLVE